MYLSEALKDKYTKDRLSAPEAQRLAEYIAWGPVVFQASRLMIKFGILDLLRGSKEGFTIQEIAQKTNISEYAATVLLEASLSIGTVLINNETDKFTLSKTGYFLLTNPITRVNIDFNHDVNYIGWFNLEEALLKGEPSGLKHFGSWPTIYEGLSSLPEQVQKSWFGFDHYYSDCSFEQALEIVFKRSPKNLLDVGGNTGRWATQCVTHNNSVEVTILDLPQQIGLMQKATSDVNGKERIHGHGINLLDKSAAFPTTKKWDAIWMSQFLDCFSNDEIYSILSRAAKVMDSSSRLYIMETFWDRQKYETATLCLTLTTLYFTALANGNSKMYHSEVMESIVNKAGLVVEEIFDGLGQGHSIMVCKLK